MEILWVLMALVMLGFVLLPVLRRRRGVIEQVPPGHPDAADPANYGFAPTEELDVRMPGPDQDLLDVLDLVQRTQDYRAAQQLLAGTEAAGELRWQRVQAFAGAASLELQQRPGRGRPDAGAASGCGCGGPRRPKDAGGAAVHAEFLVQQAWRTATPGTDEFRIIMEEARSACGDAALLARDPMPYIEWSCRWPGGWADQRPEFEQLWLKILDRAPAHMGAHLAALHYWCEKWHGSRELAYSFAEAAAARTPKGSLLAAMPLFAVFEHLPEVNLVSSFYQSEVVTKAIHGALHAVHSARPDDPMLAHVRHLLVFFLVRAERWTEAMNQLIHIDGHVGALPGPSPPTRRRSRLPRPGGGTGAAAARRPCRLPGVEFPPPPIRCQGVPPVGAHFLHSRTPQMPPRAGAARPAGPAYTVPERHTVLGTPLLGPYPGAWGRRFGLRLWGPSASSGSFPRASSPPWSATRAVPEHPTYGGLLGPAGHTEAVRVVYARRCLLRRL
ncbi:hypothetical protein SFUMM280S_03824 [Streptomyces fumanus]